MKNLKEISISKIYSWIIFALIILNVIAFIFVANKLYFRLDMTEGQKYSLSKPTLEIIKKLKNNLIIEYYYNDKSKEMKEMAQTIQYVEDMLKEYEGNSRGKVSVLIKQINLEKDAQKANELQSAGLQQFSLNESGDTEAKTLLGMSGIIVKYMETQRVIPVIYNDVGFEYNLDTEINKILGESVGNLGIMIGSTQTIEKEFAYVKQLAEKEFKDVKVIAPGTEIASDITNLIIIGGELFSESDIFQIDQFFMRGGKAFIALSGVKVTINQYGVFGTPAENKLNELLASYGIKVNKDLVGDNDSYNAVPQRQGGAVKQFRYPIWPKIKSANINRKHPITGEINRINLFWPSSIDLDNQLKNTSEVLFKTTKASWSITSDFKLDPQTYMYPLQEGKKEYNIAYAVTGKFNSFFKDKEIPKNTKGEPSGVNKLESGNTKLVVAANENFIQNDFAGNEELYFMMNSIDWMSKDGALTQIRGKGKFNKPLDKAGNQKEFENLKNLIIAITTYIIPLIFVLIGVLVFVRRQIYNKKLKEFYSSQSNNDKEGEK